MGHYNLGEQLMSKSVVDGAGNYLVTLDDGDPSPPEAWGGVAIIPSCPDDASQKWTGKAWGPPVPPVAETPPRVILRALLNKGILSAADIAAASAALPANGTGK